MADLGPAHAALLFDDLTAAELYTYIPDEPPASIAALEDRFAHLASGGRDGERWRNWVAVSLDGGRPVATLQATVYPDRRAVIAYAVMPPFWRQGFAAEAVAWMLDTVRREHDVARAEAVTDTRNVASIRLVVALGFHHAETITAALKGRPSAEHRFVKLLEPAG